MSTDRDVKMETELRLVRIHHYTPNFQVSHLVHQRNVEMFYNAIIFSLDIRSLKMNKQIILVK